MNWSRVFPLLLFTMLSCKQAENPKEQFLKWTQKGVVVDKVVCKIDANQSYSLYLPTSYDVNKTYPVIYAFDPHGNGHIPVMLMKNSAEHFGFIVIGSNNSRNGLSSAEINSIVKTLLSDTQQKISIDSHRIYTAGFSGGARVACSIAQNIGGVKGVIACSAGFRIDGKPLGCRFIGIAETQDMNYLEVKQLSDYLESVHQPHQFLVFKGKHQWPPESIMSDALYMLELYAMRDSLISVSEKTISEYNLKSNSRISKLTDENNPDSLALTFSLLNRNIQILDGLTDVETDKMQLENLRQNEVLQKYFKEQSSIESHENQKQKEYVSSFGTRPLEWWSKEISRLNITIKSPSSSLKRDVSKRLLAYISLNCYGYVNGALHYSDWKAAAYFTAIYRGVDPENPDCWYALACLQANIGKPVDAVESLKNAIKFGFSDFSKMKNDPLLTSLQGIPEFNRIAKK